MVSISRRAGPVHGQKTYENESTLNIPGPIRRGKKRSKLCVRLKGETKNGRQGPIGAVELGEPARV